jgi:uracil-DNA glycosylase family 4
VPVKTRSSGPVPADILGVGEAPGAEEEIQGIPFVGSSGQEATRILHEAGFVRSEWFLTNVCKYRPPENKIEEFFLDSKRMKPNDLLAEGVRELHEEIRRVKPKLIVGFGDTALWALTGKHGITKWRGSTLEYDDGERKIPFLPTYHPALIMREWSYRAVTVHDLRARGKVMLEQGVRVPDYKFEVRPSFEKVMERLAWLLDRAEEMQRQGKKLRLAYDLETRLGYIACLGIAWSRLEAICIPFMCVERPTGYWNVDQETALWLRLRILSEHPNVEVVGQNFLYDAQYFARRWGFIPNLKHDTMFMQNVAFAGMPKGLDFLSSMYCQFHRYWKDEGKDWEPGVPEEQLWSYNCTDAVATFEVAEVLLELLERLKLSEQYKFQMRLWPCVLRMMLRGLRVDELRRGSVAGEIIQASTDRQQTLNEILGEEINVRSPKQLATLFYDVLKQKKVLNRQTRRPTCDEEALKLIAEREPLLRCITEPIVDLRSLGVMMSNIIKAPLDADGRIRSAFSPTAETYRWTSSKNAFGGGTNLQNWTKGDEDKEKSAIVGYPIPNVRKLIVPDIAFEIASVDLSGADAQTVAWEAGDEDLKAAFRAKVKIHAHNAKVMFPGRAITGFEQPYYDLSRTGVHLVDFLGGEAMLAHAMGISIFEARSFINTWFTAHPAIREWHERIADELSRTRTVTNGFGYRRFFFDRIEGILPEAIAWKCQSNTACICNRGFVAAEEQTEMINDLQIQFLLQVHDELVFQYPIHLREQALKALRPVLHVTVPYDDPLVIPWGLKTSTVSWGDCKPREWPQ